MKITPEQLDLLKILKKTDQTVLSLQTEKKEAPHLIDNLEKKVAQAQSAKKKVNDLVEELQLVQMQIEEDLSSAKDGLKRANEKLQNISNDMEFKAATKEVEQIKEIINTKTLELPPAVEKVTLARKELEAKELLLKAAEEERQSCPEDINELFKAIDDKLEGISVERSAVTKNVDSPILVAYEKALTNRGGLALVSVDGGNCGGCKVKVRPQLYNQVLQGQLEECETCRRLLFAN